MALDLLRLRLADRVDHLAAPSLPAGTGVLVPAPGRQAYSARPSTWQPFALRQVAAHQPPPPPVPDSPAAQAVLDEVRQLSAQVSEQRSTDQFGAATHWNALRGADYAALRRPWLKAHGSTLIDALRTKALFGWGAVDAMVAESGWNCQFQRWRPPQALAAQGVSDWVPPATTPNGPEYPHGMAIWAGTLGALQPRQAAAPGTWPLAVTNSETRTEPPQRTGSGPTPTPWPTMPPKAGCRSACAPAAPWKRASALAGCSPKTSWSANRCRVDIPPAHWPSQLLFPATTTTD